MIRYHPPDSWLGGCFAALVTGLVSGSLTVLACICLGHFNHPAAYACGALAGVGLASLMGWLFYWRQLGVGEIWNILRALFEAFFYL